MRHAARVLAVLAALAAGVAGAGCGDEDPGGGPAGGFDDRAPGTDVTDDVAPDATQTTEIGPVVEGSDTEAGEPPGAVGNVEGEGDVDDLEPGDG